MKSVCSILLMKNTFDSFYKSLFTLFPGNLTKISTVIFSGLFQLCMVVLVHFQEHSLSFAPRMFNSERTTTSDWLNHNGYAVESCVSFKYLEI